MSFIELFIRRPVMTITIMAAMIFFRRARVYKLARFGSSGG